MSTKQDALSSWVCLVDGCPDDEDSYRLDIQGESCLGCPDLANGLDIQGESCLGFPTPDQGLDVQGESCLGCLDCIWPIS